MPLNASSASHPIWIPCRNKFIGSSFGLPWHPVSPLHCSKVFFISSLYPSYYSSPFDPQFHSFKYPFLFSSCHPSLTPPTWLIKSPAEGTHHQAFPWGKDGGRKKEGREDNSDHGVHLWYCCDQIPKGNSLRLFCFMIFKLSACPGGRTWQL